MYKTIVLHVDDGSQFPARLRIAAALAERHGAHLIGSAVTGSTARDYAMAAATPFGALPLVDLTELRERASAALERFSEEARRLGVASLETRLIEEDAERALVLQSAYADLIVVGQDNVSAIGTSVVTGVPDYVALHGTRPVLVVPHGCQNSTVGSGIVIGWNASAEASRAVLTALPLLRQAGFVRVVVIDPQPLGIRHGEEPGADLATYLARHGIDVEVSVETDGAPDAGDALLAHALRHGADLVVAGAYGHSRFREWVAGGTTRTLLDNAVLPVLLAH